MNAAIRDGESLGSCTTVSFSIMICSSLVQSKQHDSAVLSVKVTMQYIIEEIFKKKLVECNCSSLYFHTFLLLYSKKYILKREKLYELLAEAHEFQYRVQKYMIIEFM